MVRRTPGPTPGPPPFRIVSKVWRMRHQYETRPRAAHLSRGTNWQRARAPAFYLRSGTGAKGSGNAPPPGTWAPFNDIKPHPQGGTGPWLDKQSFYDHYQTPELGYGNQTNKDIADWLGTQQIPAPEETHWRQAQGELDQALGRGPSGGGGRGRPGGGGGGEPGGQLDPEGGRAGAGGEPEPGAKTEGKAGKPGGQLDPEGGPAGAGGEPEPGAKTEGKGGKPEQKGGAPKAPVPDVQTDEPKTTRQQQRSTAPPAADEPKTRKTTEPVSGGKGKSSSKPEFGKTPPSGGATKLTPDLIHKGTGAITRVIGRFATDLMSNARAHAQDKDVVDLLDTVEKTVDVYAFLSDPKGFVARKVSNELIGGVFRHFSGALAEQESKYVARFPEPAEFHRDPLGGGASLDDIRTLYEQARARYIGARLDKQRRLVALGYELEHSHLTRLQQTELLKEVLAGKGNIPDLEHQFIKAKNAYAFALTAVSNSLDDVRADLAAQRKDFAQDLHRRWRGFGASGQGVRGFR